MRGIRTRPRPGQQRNPCPAPGTNRSCTGRPACTNREGKSARSVKEGVSSSDAAPACRKQVFSRRLIAAPLKIQWVDGFWRSRLSQADILSRLTLIVLLPLSGLACESPAKPGSSFTMAGPVSPPNNAQISFYKQPITLGASGGVTTGRGPVTAIFEVAKDEGFSEVVATKSQAANGQPISVTLDRLVAAKDYFWHVKTNDGNGPALVSAVFKFTVSPEIRIEPPRLLHPLPDAFDHRRPLFVVGNAAHSGPTNGLTYRFEIANDPAFSAIASIGNVEEGAGQTAFTPGASLGAGQMYYWRARAIDTDTGVSSNYSTAQTFTTKNPDDGTYAYTFHFQPPATEDCEYVVDNATFRYKHALDFPVSLVVVDDALTIDEGLVLHANRARDQLSGIIVGLLSLTPYARFSFSALAVRPGDPLVPARFLGSADPRGNLAGTFSGGAMTADCCYWWACAAPDFKWTLTPR